MYPDWMGAGRSCLAGGISALRYLSFPVSRFLDDMETELCRHDFADPSDGQAFYSVFKGGDHLTVAKPPQIPPLGLARTS